MRTSPATSGARSSDGLACEPSGRVALVVPSLSGGGAERVLSMLANRWARDGRDVVVVTVSSRDTDFYELAPGILRHALDLQRSSRNAVDGVLQTSRRVIALRRALLRSRPDVVVSFIAPTNVLVLLATLGMALPVHVSERTDPRQERLGAGWTLLRRLLYPRASSVIVQTASVAGWARRFCPRVYVIPNPVERPARSAEPDAACGPKQLIAMGRLSPEKGFDLLIHAFARVATLHPDWTLTILGEGPERTNLLALARAVRLADRISLPGHVVDPNRHLAASHAFALSSRFEGFPNALLEAMACGLPVVAFACPSGPAEIIEHERNGILVDPGDVARFAEALASLMSSPSERMRIGQNARSITALLAPERVIARWDALLRDSGA